MKIVIFLKNHQKLSAALLFVIVICIFYAPVVFFNKSLQPPLYYPNSITEKGVYGYEGRKPINSFNIDLATPIYGEWGSNKLIGDIYKEGKIPLWDPYQSAGRPLVEQYSSKIFPYQILENIFPNWTWDFFILGRLWIAGFFTFLFLLLLRLSPFSAFLGGLFYMFSGSLVWFINFETMTNVVMMVPVLFWSLEKLVQGRRFKNTVLPAFVFGLVLLAGIPSITLYIFLLAGAYFIFKLFKGIKPKHRVKCLLLLLLAFVLGLELAAPQIFLFLDFLPLSYNYRQPGAGFGNFGILSVPANLSSLIIAPGVSEIPTFYRFWPQNGLWDNIGGYSGIMVILLIIFGFILAFSKKTRLRKYLLFFSGFGLFILLKNFGLPPFVWLGKLPLFNMVWSPRWAGPAWVFSFAIAGAVGFEIIKRRLESLKLIISKISRSGFLKGLIILSLLALLVIFMNSSTELISSNWQAEDLDLSSILLINWLVVILTLITAIWLIWHYSRTGKGLYGLIILAILELWFWIPKGYETRWQYLELLLFLFGIAIVILALKEKWRWLLVGSVIFLLFYSVVDFTAPYGFPSRYNPFTKPPYVDYLKNQKGYYRVIGGDGILMPNFADAFRLMDVRYINSLSLATYHNYRFNNLHKYQLLQDSSSYWFTGMPEFFPEQGVDYFSLSIPEACRQKLDISTKEIFRPSFLNPKAVYYPLEEEIRYNLPFYSLLGVKYILMPASKDINKAYNIKEGDPFYFPLVYQNEINIFENPSVFPRAFVVYQLERAFSWQEAQGRITQPEFDLRNEIILEEEIPEDCCLADTVEGEEKVEIKDYQPNQVVIEAFTEKPGFLVLTDVFYPGWQAEIDGNPTKIYRVDGLFRGVYLEQGNHRIVFKYLPKSFKMGVLVSFLALFICLSLIIFPKKND